MDLKKIVRDKIAELGVAEASKFFRVSVGTISNWSNGNTNPTVDAVQLVLADSAPELVTNEVTWEGRDVMILLPVYRTFNADTHYTLFANYAKYGPEKVAMEVIKRTMIHECRNMLIDKFMNSTATKAIMIDDDMVLPCGSVGVFNGRYNAGVPEANAGLNTITRLLSHGPENGIVGGLYFGRHDIGQAQCEQGFGHNQAIENERLRKFKYQGLLKTGWVGTGCIKIERWVIEKMKKAIDDGMWPECKPSMEGSWYGYFNPQKVRVGEDVSFGRRASELGIQSYVDTSLICLHSGDRWYGPTNTKNP